MGAELEVGIGLQRAALGSGSLGVAGGEEEKRPPWGKGIGEQRQAGTLGQKTHHAAQSGPERDWSWLLTTPHEAALGVTQSAHTGSGLPGFWGPQPV